ncbi:MAG TPA: ferrous iron transport protein A [Chloroflexi bacterium]|jgi:ferrous iron transport protein A|nr:ferrous iron transport protein A [Chloroflexota bacterium]
MQSNIISLSELGAGEEGTVIQLHGGNGFVGRMAALGFTPGTTVRVVRNPGHGALIVSLLDTQIALGRGQAMHVLVSKAANKSVS